ncbi:MAG: O-antigen ligase family protein, partial [candidate division WWE3 bacterium]|nr:O-antigen ligase family protein [candidate division WWE3 bacterium]
MVLPLIVFVAVFERFNFFLPALGFSLKLSLILLPVVALVLLIRKKLSFNPTFLFPFLALVILVEILSIPFSFDPFQSFQVVVFHLLMIGLFYLIVWNNRNNLKGSREESGGDRLDRLVWAWGIGAAVVSILGFWQFARYFWGLDPTLPFDQWFAAKTLPVGAFVQTFYEWLNLAVLRPSSTFIDVSTGASFVGIFILLGLGWFVSWGRNDRRRVLMGALMVFSSLYFMIALSRSAALGLVAGLAAFSYLVLRDRINLRKLKILIIAVVIAVLGAGIGFSIVSPERLGSAVARLKYVQAAVEMLKHNPITGVGAGNFEPYYTQVLSPGAPAGYSHSIFLTWLGELGILGFLANLLLIAAVILVVGRSLRSLKQTSFWYARLVALLAAFVALVFA